MVRHHRIESILRRPCLALVAVLACAAPGRALAAPANPTPPSAVDRSPDEQAAHWLRAGNRAFKEGRFAEAEKAYREAFAVKKGYDIAGNLGAAELAQGKLREAAQHLAFTLRMFPITGEPALRAQMAKAYEECRQGVAALHIDASVRGAAILVDGAPAGETPLLNDVFVEPGEHVVEARLDGYAGATRRVVAQKGAAVDVKLDLSPVPPLPRPAPPQEPVPPIRRSLAPGLGLVAAAVVGLGGGVAFFSLSASKRADAASLAASIVGPAPHHGCVSAAANYDAGSCPTLASTLHSDDTYHDVAVGSVLVGSVAAVGAAAYFLWPQRRPVSGLRVTPILGSGDRGVVVSGSF